MRIRYRCFACGHDEPCELLQPEDMAMLPIGCPHFLCPFWQDSRQEHPVDTPSHGSGDKDASVESYMSSTSGSLILGAKEPGSDG